MTRRLSYPKRSIERQSKVRPTYKGLRPASETTSRIARAASAKRNTQPELLLRRALRGVGLRYKMNVGDLPGCPDFVISASRVAVFCDGDFWHGRNLRRRLSRLRLGHNSTYWVSKITTNVKRDRRINRQLEASGWTVIRLWESDVMANPKAAVTAVLRAARRLPSIQAKRIRRPPK
jgi:DNA mismatch endonuclease, patch repair protein